MSDPKVSVLTLVKGRQDQLRNVVRFLGNQTRLPDELVVACMDSLDRTDLFADFPIKLVDVEDGGLPLAKARNQAASAASGGLLIFLDVDCLPSPDLVASYTKSYVSHPEAAFMGEVFYLPALPQERFEEGENFNLLMGEGVRHPSKRPFTEFLEPEPDHGELWGLSFALGSTTFRDVGGFDERFERYGAEETDFATALDHADVPLYRCPAALALHQHHVVHIPPVQHFDSIVANAQRFYDKWGRWCMDYWLGQFREKGWIEWTADSIKVLERPGEADLAESQQNPEVRFS